MAGKLITLRDMLEEVYGQLKTTLAGTELGRTVEVSPHSPLWYPLFGRNRRGWLSEICKRRSDNQCRAIAAPSLMSGEPSSTAFGPINPSLFGRRMTFWISVRTRSAVDKALQRLALSGDLRRIDRGICDVPRVNALTGQPSTPNYSSIIGAVTRREKARFLPDGMTAANQLGLTDAVPAKITVHTDARLRPIQLHRLVIDFKLTAPSRLYWAGRPAMRIVQALHWLHDMLPADGDSILKKIRKILEDPKQGKSLARPTARARCPLPMRFFPLPPMAPRDPRDESWLFGVP